MKRENEQESVCSEEIGVSQNGEILYSEQDIHDFQSKLFKESNQIGREIDGK